MRRCWRVRRIGILALGMTAWGTASVGAEEAAPPDLESRSPWQQFVSVRGFGGYQDNVLLSSIDPQGSAFAGVGLDAIGWRPVGELGEFQAYLVGDYRHFFSVREVSREETVVAGMEYRHDFSLDWSAELPIEYLHIYQVMDVSATEDVRLPTQVQGNSVGVRPAVQRHWVKDTLELRVNGLRQFYAEPLDNSWEAGMGIDWLRRLTDRTLLNVTYDFGHLWYDTETEREPDGLPIPGTERQMNRHEVGLRLRHDWGAKKEWRVSGRLTGQLARDDGGGYYNFWRPGADLSLRYRRGPWLARTSVRGRHYRYQVQQVSLLDSDLRRRSEFVWDIRGERELVAWLRLFVEYAYEETWTNRSLEDYSVQTFSGGLEASF